MVKGYPPPLLVDTEQGPPFSAFRKKRRRQGGNVRVEFADTGRGFSPIALARHAELFYTEKEGGMGIGLSVSTEILKAHRGVLTVGNGPDGGAVVTFLIPAI